MPRPVNSKRNCSMSFEQKDIMIKFLTAMPQLSSGKFDSNFTHMTAQNHWQQLTHLLNSTKGSTKDWREWRKTWQDMKTRAKHKNLKIRQSTVKSGEELSLQDQLNSLEEEVTAQLITKASLAKLADMDESSTERPNDASISFTVNTKSMECSEAEQSETEYSAEEEQSVGVDSISDVNATVTSQRKLYTPIVELQRNPDVTSTIFNKENYYNKKLVLLERLADAEERKAAAEERKAAAEERKAIAEERMAAAEERKVAVEERMVAVEERKVAAQERKAAVLEHTETKDNNKNMTTSHIVR